MTRIIMEDVSRHELSEKSSRTTGFSVRCSTHQYIKREIYKAAKAGKVRTKRDKEFCEITLIALGADVATRDNRTSIAIKDVDKGWNRFVTEPRTRNIRVPSRRNDRGRIMHMCPAGVLLPHNCMDTIIQQKVDLLTRKDFIGEIISDKLKIS